jgi:uncharacterized protein (TIGR02118 family)
MITRIGSAPRAQGLSMEEFQRHWRGEHGGLAGQIPGLRSYVQNHAVLRDGRTLLPYIGSDAFSELTFDSVEAMDEGFGSEFYRRAVVADEGVLIDKTRFYLLLSERRVLDDREPAPGAVKLVTFLPLEARATRAELADALAGPYRDAVAAAPILRHEQLLEIPGAHEGRQAPICAAVDLLWFADEDAALAFVAGEAGDRARRSLSGLAFGLERVIARPNVVI